MRCPKCGGTIPKKKYDCDCGYKINFKRLPPPPQRLGMVNDYEGILSGDSLGLLSRLAADFEKKAGVEIVVAVLSNSLPLDPEKYAYYLYNFWKIGKNNNNRGILLLASMKEKRVEIEIGYGLEKTISEESTEKLLDDFVVPKFKEYKYTEGLVEGVKEIIKEIEAKASL